MKIFKLLTGFILGTLFMGQTYGNVISVSPNDQSSYISHLSSAIDSPGKDYDFSYLKPGETMDITGYDSNGKPFKYRVTRTSNGVDVAIYSDTIRNADPGTVITFKGPEGIISSTTLGQVSSQRCGSLCILAHFFCVKVHIGPPGNTWEWDCSKNDD
jgi:Neuraminidase (sialidase)